MTNEWCAQSRTVQGTQQADQHFASFELRSKQQVVLFPPTKCRRCEMTYNVPTASLASTPPHL